MGAQDSILIGLINNRVRVDSDLDKSNIRAKFHTQILFGLQIKHFDQTRMSDV